MQPELLGEVAGGFRTDAAMLALSVRAGEPIDQSELIALSAGAQCIFSLATLLCRQLDRIDQCQELWVETLELFRQAQSAWDSIEGDQYVKAFRRQLSRVIELAEDRLKLYAPPS